MFGSYHAVWSLVSHREAQVEGPIEMDNDS